MIEIGRVHEVPVERLLAVAGIRCTPTLGLLAIPSPRATKKQRRIDPLALKIDRRTGTWTDHQTGRSGDDVAGLLAYAVGTTREAALRRLAGELSPRDTLLNRCIRPGDTGRGRLNEGEGVTLPTASAAVEAEQLRKFALRGTPRQRADALVTAAWKIAAADRGGRRP
jgi:hypothetical protein